MVVDSGYSSFMYNQNIFDVVHKDEQVVSPGIGVERNGIEGFRGMESSWRRIRWNNTSVRSQGKTGGNTLPHWRMFTEKGRATTSLYGPKDQLNLIFEKPEKQIFILNKKSRKYSGFSLLNKNLIIANLTGN